MVSVEIFDVSPEQKERLAQRAEMALEITRRRLNYHKRWTTWIGPEDYPSKNPRLLT